MSGQEFKRYVLLTVSNASEGGVNEHGMATLSFGRIAIQAGGRYPVGIGVAPAKGGVFEFFVLARPAEDLARLAETDVATIDRIFRALAVPPPPGLSDVEHGRVVGLRRRRLRLAEIARRGNP